MDPRTATIAGFVSTALFSLGTLPMLAKAFRTKDLSSYSVSTLLVNNVGNLIYVVYVLELPPGPVWALHGYNTLTTALMLAWYLKYEGWPRRSRAAGAPGAGPAAPQLCCPAS